MLQRLTDRFVRSAKPGKYSDGHGLILRVMPSGSKQWVQRLVIRGKRHDLGLGGYPLVALADVRIAAFENRRIARAGGDPRALRRKSEVPTFAEAVESVIAIHRPGWKDGNKSEDQWRSTLRRYAMPTIADMPVDGIDPAHVMEILVPIWHEKHVTAQRVRQRVGAVMAWSIAQGYRRDNPAADAIAAALPKSANGAKKHHAALPYSEVADAVARIRTSEAGMLVKLAFEFLILTATRSGEVRGAEWGEVDLEGRVWTIPAVRTKRSRDHRVPLSGRAIEILHEARAFADRSGLVFPPARRAKAMSSAMFSDLLKDLGIECVPHGFRSSFRDWCSQTDVPRDVAEAALAHEVRGRTERAYLRSDQFERRRRLMEEWAIFVDNARICC